MHDIKFIFLKRSLSGISIHSIFSFLSKKPKERKLKATRGKPKDQKGRKVKLRDLRVQQRTLEEVQRKTQEVHRRMVLNKKAITSQRTRKKPRDVAVLSYRSNIKTSKITAHIYEYILVHVCIEKIWENIFV